jgi:hypothetical protein
LHNEINRVKWDICLGQSWNRLPYGFSWWLDAVCPGWEALVENDYTAVMPLTAGRKFGISYLYQPYFTQQLGIFSPAEITPDDTERFLAAIPEEFRYINLQLNTGNNPAGSDFNFSLRKNYILDLTPGALQLYNLYHRNCRRNVQKAVHNRLTVKKGPGPALFTRFIRQNLEKKLAGTRKSFYPTLLELATISLENGTGEILGVYNIKNELLASGWFVTHAGRCLFLVCASTPKGKENKSMYLLVDHMIRDNAGTDLVFDFAGSNLPGVAYFNNGFGSKTTTYTAISRNLLPWPLRLLKK